MSLTIERVTDINEVPTIRLLFQEYADSMGLDLCFQNFAQEVADLPGKYSPPSGCLLLARVHDQPAGCVGLRALDDEVCEIKRLYVRSQHRGLGLGRKLADRVIEEARHLGYERVRLDTIRSKMGSAISLYEAGIFS